MNKPVNAIGTGVGLTVIGLSLLIGIGGLYWIWLSLKAGSVAMFTLGVLPPSLFVTSSIGAWSLLFGAPEWLSDYLPMAAMG